MGFPRLNGWPRLPNFRASRSSDWPRRMPSARYRMIRRSGNRFADKILRQILNLARDRTQNRYPLLLITRRGSIGAPHYGRRGGSIRSAFAAQRMAAELAAA